MPVKDETADFIRATFPSVWALELLLLLKAKQGEGQRLAALVAELRGSELAIEQGIESLVRAGLVATEADGKVRYAPAEGRLAQFVARTEARYSKRPGAVRRLIASSEA
jgi:hypothetical protein